MKREEDLRPGDVLFSEPGNGLKYVTIVGQPYRSVQIGFDKDGRAYDIRLNGSPTLVPSWKHTMANTGAEVLPAPQPVVSAGVEE